MSPSETAPTVVLPRFMYGTAWKEDRTKALTLAAINAGFTAIDTANQRKHYFEEGVGQAILASGKRRESFFLQTKFTFIPGQDQRLPYDPTAPIATQVAQSFASSLEHLGTTYLDSYVLHGPSVRFGLGEADWAAWGAMEELHSEKKALALGISNVSLDQLKVLVKEAKVKPLFVQNRCYASAGWDRQVRGFCRSNDIHYQGFSLLTANSRELETRAVHDIALRHRMTVAQVIFRFAMQIGMLPLTGTTNSGHMLEDLASECFNLSPDDLMVLEKIGERP